uniref:Uncharacterized protein n=1 Tax=Theropithecus gelada TaxID=9565 RepID=A0A8D2F579_THEGE
MALYKTEQDDWLIVYLKHLLLVFNVRFWMRGAAVLAMGIWTLVERSSYLSIVASSTFAASACILIWAGTLVMATSFLGYSTISQEQKGCFSVKFLPVSYHLAELVAGVLAHLSDEQKQHLSRTLTENYGQVGATQIPTSVDRRNRRYTTPYGLEGQADTGSNPDSLLSCLCGPGQPPVPASCCKAVVALCSQPAHPSNVCKGEVSAPAWPPGAPKGLGSGRWAWEKQSTHDP